MFNSFPQMGSGGFPGMGQQFHVPQIFGPRPSAVDMGLGGTRFHINDSGGSSFSGHGSNNGPVMGWHRFPDGNESHPPLSGFMDTSWECQVRYPDERQRLLHPEWDQFSQGLTRGWAEVVSEPWEGQNADSKFDSNQTHINQECLSQVKNRGEPGSILGLDSKMTLVMDDRAPQEISEVSPAHTSDLSGKASLKSSTNRSKTRLQMMFLHAGVSAEVAGVDLYEEYLTFLSPSEAKRKEINDHNMIVPTTFLDEDLEFEVKGTIVCSY